MQLGRKIYKNKERITVIIPQIPIAKPLIAPSVSPISSAFEVPIAWLEAPMARPAVIESFTWNSLIRTGARMLPRIPVKITATTVTGTTPPWLSAMLTAIGVVTDLGRREAVMASSRPNSRHNP